MNNLCWLAQIEDSERTWVGEKAFFLGLALQCHAPILPGFVIKSQVSQDFFTSLETSSSLLSNLVRFPDYLNSNDYQALQALAVASRNLVLNSLFPEKLQTEVFAAAQQLRSSQLIIRPSLLAHQLPNLGSHSLIEPQFCTCNPQAVAQAIKSVWADLFTVKNLFYWYKLGVQTHQLQLALLIQPITNAIASGAVTLNSQTAYIQSIWGLGYGLNRGEVDPDRYQINLHSEYHLDLDNSKLAIIGSKRRGYRLITKTVNANKVVSLETYSLSEEHQQKTLLSPVQLQALTRLSKRISQLPTPIKYWEWALISKQDAHDQEFIITQLSSQAPNLQDRWSTSENNQNSIILRGIPAATGSITSKVFVHQDLDNHLDSLPSNVILVAKSIDTQHLNLLQNLAGIVTEQGGQTSHSAIIARELGIPAVVAAKDATSILKTGDLITLDGSQGTVIEPMSPNHGNNSNRSEPETNPSASYASKPSPIPLATKLLVTISQSSSIKQAKRLPVEGVGLLRSEFMLMKMLSIRPIHEWLQPKHKQILLNYLIETIGQFVTEFSPKPIYYRSLDFSLVASTQHNPQPRNRGTYAYLKNSSFFELELAALVAIMEQQPSNLKLVLPFVRSLREWQFCHNLVQRSGLTNYRHFQLWIMLEVPSLIFILPEYLDAGAQGVIIGMNDLTQLLLGIDREHNELSKQHLTGNFLAIERAITQIIQTTKANRIPCSVCLSEQSGNLDFLEKLVRWGINMISVEPQSVLKIHHGIIQAERRLIEDL